MIRLDVVVQLEDLAEWFDNPKLSPFIVVKIGSHQQYTAGYLLRCIAQSLEADGWDHGTLCDLRGPQPPQRG